MVVEDPREDVTDTWEDASSCEKDAGIAGSGFGGCGEENVPDGADEGHEDYDEAALLGAVGDVGCGYDEEKGEEVGGCGEASIREALAKGFLDFEFGCRS